MMPYIVWAAGLFDGTNREESEEVILKLLSVLVDQNCKYLRKHPETAKLYDMKEIRYALPDQMTRAPKPEDIERVQHFISKEMGYDDEIVDIITTVLRGCEIFRDVPTILKKKEVDCDNLATWRVAELRCAGIEAVPYIIWRESDRGTTYHALLRWPDGTSEDPSRILGMGDDVERNEEKRKNRERYGNFITTAHQRCVDGETNPILAGQYINALGLVPKDNSW